MDKFNEGMMEIDKAFGNGKDNLIAVATLAVEDGKPRPVVRTVDAMYEDGVFYTVTNAQSNKMRQIAQNPEVSVAGCHEMLTASGIGENIGWVLEPRNAELRTKLRAAFSAWYDAANNENDKNCCIMAIRLTKGIMNVNHWERLYHMDFANKKIVEGM